MTPDERLEAAARLVCELDPHSPGPDEPIMVGTKRAKAWEPRAETIRKAIDAGLFAWPPKAWLAPMRMTTAMKDAVIDAANGGMEDTWRAARDAYLKEDGK